MQAAGKQLFSEEERTKMHLQLHVDELVDQLCLFKDYIFLSVFTFLLGCFKGNFWHVECVGRQTPSGITVRFCKRELVFVEGVNPVSAVKLACC